MHQFLTAAAIDFSALLGSGETGLQGTFESAVTSVLPIAGVIFAAVIAYRFIRKIIKGAG